MDKRFVYGTLSTAMMLLAVVVFVMANLLADAVDVSGDLTAERIYSLTEQSREFLSELEADVTITYIAGAGQELRGDLEYISRIIRALLEEYGAYGHITVQERDPLLNPGLIRGFAAEAGLAAGVENHSVVVQSGGNIRIISPLDMLEFEFNPFTGATRILSFNVEREITRAIHHVVTGMPTVVYYVTGSGEQSLPPQFIDFLHDENFVLREVNATLHDIPEEAEIIFIPMPARDWTQTKAARILAFLQDEGNAFFALGLPFMEMPNLAAVLDAYGLALGNQPIIEDNMQHIFAGRREFYILPNMIIHGVTENLRVREFANIIPFFVPEIAENPIRRPTLTIEPLWRTSREAFSRPRDFEGETLEMTEYDTAGPFILAAAVTDRIFEPGRAYYTRMVVTSYENLTEQWVTTYVGEGNRHFVVNAFRWMIGQPPSVFIPVRTPPGEAPIIIPSGTSTVISVVSMGGIPLVFLLAGAVVWFRRRNA